MQRLFTVGRILYAIAILSLGLEHLIWGNFPIALLPFPAKFPGRFVVVLAMGIAFVLAGIGLGSLRLARQAALWLGVLFLLLVFYPHLPILVTNIYNGGAWTVLTELTALSGGAFYLSGTLSQSLKNRFDPAVFGRILFAVSLLIFAIQHFMYAQYISTLIPAWIPARLFWAYFVGVAFAGTAVSLLLNRQLKLTTGLLGLMFFLWVILLHTPRTMAHPQSEPEWTSLFIALAMSGISFAFAGFEEQKVAAFRTNPLASY
ncbi:hypothetical protein [Larkinella terrae]|uniref:DoxX family membrane protein n=1 Tax=Larkinella terrae TaxID=2025311 RepID=A0A7K0ESK3_9BACT|nr:hypothetical protein [Larkinella terrae]MRS64793.1 hypothetical protein [Larkinella terrae]